jgi:hypothetical protein
MMCIAVLTVESDIHKIDSLPYLEDSGRGFNFGAKDSVLYYRGRFASGLFYYRSGPCPGYAASYGKSSRIGLARAGISSFLGEISESSHLGVLRPAGNGPLRP